MPRNRNLERPWLICALLVLAVLAVYLPVIELSFLTYDDDYYVTRNPHVAGGLTSAGLRWAFAHVHSANWHPLTWLSHMLDCQIYGLAPAGHHLTNLLFHAANAVLLFLWLRSLTNAFWRSAFVAALFALHPLHVESVAWVAERKDVLCSFFGLLSLWTYTRYVEGRSRDAEYRSQRSGVRGKTSGGGSNRTADHGPRTYDPVTVRPGRDRIPSSIFYLLSLFFFALGLMSKPMLVTWPCLMLLLDYWPLRRMQNAECRMQNAKPGNSQLSTLNPQPSPRPFSLQPLAFSLLDKLPFFALSTASCIITLAAQKTGGALVTLTALPLGARMLNAMDSYVHYIVQLFWPANLAVIYTFAGRPSAGPALAALLLAAITLAVLWQRKRRPYLLVGWAWYLGTLVPVIGLVQVGNQTMADRYTYLPAIGIFLMLAWGATELAGALLNRRSAKDASLNRPPPGHSGELPMLRRFGLAAAATAALGACALTTSSQLRYWQNSESLFRHALSVNPNNFIAWNGLGYYLAEQGQARQAEACYRAAVAISPSFAEAWNGLGYALANLGKHDEAITSYEKAVSLSPDDIKARNNLAIALAACGRTADAKAQCRAASQADPEAAEPHSNLGALLAREGQWDQAIAEYSLALARDPSLNEARCGLAGALAKQGKLDDAVRELTDLLRLQPAYGPAHLQLGAILAQRGKADEAIIEFNTLLRANPGDSAAHYHLALALAAQGESKEALAHYRAAITSRPDFPEALNNLAWMLATHPNPQIRDGRQALELAERACRLTQYKEALMLGTLGAAYAEAGRFPEAVEAAEKAKALAEKADDSETATMNTKLLALYRSGQPYRKAR
jgi:tetratricopeptide (TPR) repeat protein